MAGSQLRLFTSGRYAFACPSLAQRCASSTSLAPADVEFLKRFKDPDLPKGTRVGSMVMGDVGLYNEKLRESVERYTAAHNEGKPVHEWNGSKDKMINALAHFFLAFIFVNIGLQSYGLVVDATPLIKISEMFGSKKK